MMAYDKNEFGDDNEIPRFEEEEERTGERDEIMEDDAEELVIPERPGPATPAPPPSLRPSRPAGKKKAGGKSRRKARAKKAKKLKKTKKRKGTRKTKSSTKRKRAGQKGARRRKRR